MEHFLSKELIWTRKPQQAVVTRETVEIVTEPHTDLWQRTYYGFQNDNAPVLQIRTKEPYFSFTVRTEFHSKRRFDQCGIALYLDSENWLKASIEYENERFQRLGSVVTNHGYSDWATTDIPAGITEREQANTKPHCPAVRGTSANAARKTGTAHSSTFTAMPTSTVTKSILLAKNPLPKAESVSERILKE